MKIPADCLLVEGNLVKCDEKMIGAPTTASMEKKAPLTKESKNGNW